jgi:hypothetical protein
MALPDNELHEVSCHNAPVERASINKKGLKSCCTYIGWMGTPPGGVYCASKQVHGHHKPFLDGIYRARLHFGGAA